MKFSVLSSLLAGAAICAALPTIAELDSRQASRFTFYNLKTPLASPCDMTTGPDGYIWADTFTSNKLVRVIQKTGQLDEYSIPYTLPVLNISVLPQLQGTVALACVVQPGKDGRLYFATGIRNQFGRMDLPSHKIEVFNTGNPAGNLQPFNDAWPGDTGMFFSQTTGNVISLFDYKTTKIRNYQIPTPASGPVGMIVAQDGALWFCEMLANKIGRLNATTGEIKEYPVLPTLAGPAVMRAEVGKYLYFTAITGNAIGQIDITTGLTKAFTITNGALAPIEDTVDPKGNIWFSSATDNVLSYLTPSTGTFTTIPVPDSVPEPISIPPTADIAIHYDNVSHDMWFTQLSENRIGRYKLGY